MSMSGQERRGSPRRRVRITAHCRIGHRFVREPIGDLSDGGLYLETSEPARLGSRVQVSLVLPGSDGPEYCTLHGVVARVDEDGAGKMRGVAIRFDRESIAPADRDLLDGFLRREDADDTT